jgi:riboflavin synthase
VFTGIVTAVGTVRRRTADRAGGVDLTIAAPWRGVALGESIAVDGACLTVAARGRGWFRVHPIATTLRRTLLGTLATGDRVNLERALKAGDRLGGHLVQGHVDGVARVARTATEGDAWLVDLAVPAAVARVSVPLGSITVDGVSLTVNAIPRAGIIQISLIPYTRDHTTLGALRRGDRVHVEGDLIGKYVRELVERRPAPRARRAR